VRKIVIKNHEVRKTDMYIEFKEKSCVGRRKIVTLRLDEIKSLESIEGGECTELKVNGIEVEGSYEHLMEILQNPQESLEEGNPFTKHFKVYREGEWNSGPLGRMVCTAVDIGGYPREPSP